MSPAEWNLYQTCILSIYLCIGLFNSNLCTSPTSVITTTLRNYVTSASLDFFFFPFIFISWRLITLQYCSGFCYTLT